MDQTEKKGRSLCLFLVETKAAVSISHARRAVLFGFVYVNGVRANDYEKRVIPGDMVRMGERQCTVPLERATQWYRL